jgi:exonuclease III
MNYTTWKIATLNVKGINDTFKFDDIMKWIIENDIDATILTKTKINQIKANFKIKKIIKASGFWMMVLPKIQEFE